MNDNILIPIGKRIAEIRRSKSVTQEKLAEILGVSPKHISHAERGVSGLSLKNLIEFCNMFDCSLDYLIFGRTEKTLSTKLPDEIVKILLTGNTNEVERLTRYLQMYIELTNKQD